MTQAIAASAVPAPLGSAPARRWPSASLPSAPDGARWRQRAGSQNHRMFRVGRDLCGSSSPTPKDPSLGPSLGGLEVYGEPGLLLEAGGCYRPWISRCGCKHPTRTPLVLSTLGENTHPLAAQGSARGWGHPVSPESFNLLREGYESEPPGTITPRPPGGGRAQPFLRVTETRAGSSSPWLSADLGSQRSTGKGRWISRQTGLSINSLRGRPATAGAAQSQGWALQLFIAFFCSHFLPGSAAWGSSSPACESAPS